MKNSKKQVHGTGLKEMSNRRKENRAIKFNELALGNYFELFNEQYNPPRVFKKVEPYGMPGRRFNTIPRLWIEQHRWIVEVKK